MQHHIQRDTRPWIKRWECLRDWIKAFCCRPDIRIHIGFCDGWLIDFYNYFIAICKIPIIRHNQRYCMFPHWKFDFGTGLLPAVNKGEAALINAVVFLYIASRGGGFLSIDRLRSRW